jgi:YggT family protein
LELLYQLVNYFSIFFTVAIFARVILSLLAHFMKPPYPTLLVSIDRVVNQVTEPVLAPIRRMLPSFGGLDLSPMVVIIVLWFIRRVLASL